jgi:hypothetical protein
MGNTENIPILRVFSYESPEMAEKPATENDTPIRGPFSAGSSRFQESSDNFGPGSRSVVPAPSKRTSPVYESDPGMAKSAIHQFAMFVAYQSLTDGTND